MKQKLSIMEGPYTIHRFHPTMRIPKQILKEKFYSISKTDDELSIVCPSSVTLDSQKSEAGWACIKIPGPLDFTLTGILSDISTILANENISIFALSTFDTDYILVKSEKLQAAKTALRKAEYIFE